jgi:hypothetical protein
MSIAVSNVAASAAASVAPAAAAPEGAAGFKAADLDQLRSLLRDTAIQTLPPGATLPVPENVAPVQRTFGDSILDGMLSFRNGYQNSMEAINTRVADLATKETQGLNDFSEMMSLQIDVSKWTMSVMGVDNASKSATNTIKELSRG